jgi:hypothetical protein
VQYGLGVGVGYCFGYMLADTFPYGAYRVEVPANRTTHFSLVSTPMTTKTTHATHTQGESMYPTLEKNDWVLTSSRRNGLHRGDVVVLRYFCVACVVCCVLCVCRVHQDSLRVVLGDARPSMVVRAQGR